MSMGALEATSQQGRLFFVRLAPKSAAYTVRLGQRPRINSIQRGPALKVRFTSGPFGSIVGVIPQSLSKVILHIILARKIVSPGLA